MSSDGSLVDLVKLATDDLKIRLAAPSCILAVELNVWFTHWKSLHPANSELIGLLITHADVARVAHMHESGKARPPQQIVTVIGNNNNLPGVQGASVSINGPTNAAETPPVPAPAKSRSQISIWSPFVAAIIAGAMVAMWFIPMNPTLRICLTTTSSAAVVAFVIVAWVQARMAIWMQRAFMYLCGLLVVHVIGSPILSGWVATLGHDEKQAWIAFVPQSGNTVLLVSELLASVSLGILAFVTQQADPD